MVERTESALIIQITFNQGRSTGTSRWRTEVGWPIFHTGLNPGLSGTHLP